jgi:hypothetical protein
MALFRGGKSMIGYFTLGIHADRVDDVTQRSDEVEPVEVIWRAQSSAELSVSL